MVSETSTDWNAAAVRTWLERRILAARSDQVRAQRGGRDLEDDCDSAAAEEMICTLVKGMPAETQDALGAALRDLLGRDAFIWRGVYDDTRFDRHARAYIRKLARMARTNTGFGKTTHYQ